MFLKINIKYLKERINILETKSPNLQKILLDLQDDPTFLRGGTRGREIIKKE